ncbi:hypothetical protein NQZ68_022253 [Dissostichus eleginoides]|nr:hypothetical protein NQZ68_022253 [Dissostichus eleginoides]
MAEQLLKQQVTLERQERNQSNESSSFEGKFLSLKRGRMKIRERAYHFHCSLQDLGDMTVSC